MLLTFCKLKWFFLPHEWSEGLPQQLGVMAQMQGATWEGMGFTFFFFPKQVRDLIVSYDKLSLGGPVQGWTSS